MSRASGKRRRSHDRKSGSRGWTSSANQRVWSGRGGHVSAQKIPVATRDRVYAVATGLGYRPNPRIAGLMAHIRRGRTRPFGERIAFVWVHTTREEAQRSSFLQAVLAGARARAGQSGYALEEFWTADPSMNDVRLQRIIRTRGIVGVVLSPVTTAETSVTLSWDWACFAAAVIGNVTWTPELHHAGIIIIWACGWACSN